MRVLEINKLNREYKEVCEYEGPEFSRKVLEFYNIKVEYPEEDLKNFPKGQFVTVSNHAFGGVDGLIISSIAGKIQPDYKILTNFILSLIPALKETFMPVNPFHDGETNRSSYGGIKAALQHLKNGGSLGLFPAGAVSTWQKKGKRTAIRKGIRPVVEDCPWPANIAKLIKTAEAPVVPIYFDGGNSLSMHLLGRIYHLLRTARLIHELRNKRNKTIRLRIGKPIMPEDYDKFGDDGAAMINYLRNRVYCLEATLKEEQKLLKPAPERKMEPLADPVPGEAIAAEIERLADKRVFDSQRYTCYIADHKDIPACMKEIARLREQAFRSVGEGTGKALDTDIYDTWYKHLFLWDKENSKIAGAYRLGVGSEMFDANGGIKAFYAPSLVNVMPGAKELLLQCIELGRSFVARDYRKDTVVLSMLLKGLLIVATTKQQSTCFLGAASISGEYPTFYKSLIYSFLMKKYGHPEGPSILQPRHGFKPDWLRVDPDQLLFGRDMGLEEFNSLLETLTEGRYTLPPLVKFYFSNNAKAICLNVDPDFNDSLDVLTVNYYKDFSEKVVMLLQRNLDEAEARAIRETFGTSRS
ncbi:MAG: lysophospholipid acyltransferase family protein [Bacteroidales bacterium]|nr:lysophospholipid acyltransferase family protein [Bacteroidales bacterium]